jgi:hypothetical protein
MAKISHHVTHGNRELEQALRDIATDLATLQAFLGAFLYGSATYDAASLADGVGATTTITVTGAVVGDFVLVSHGVDVSGITVTGYVSAADTVSVRLQNESGGTLDLASSTLRALVLKKSVYNSSQSATLLTSQ